MSKKDSIITGLVILCISLTITTVYQRQKAAKLNDQLYIANVNWNNEYTDNIHLKSEIEKLKQENTQLKEELSYEKTTRKSIEQEYDNYMQEAESYIDELETDQIYNRPYYYH